jgi:tRNA 2-thiouridine synthesizing protein A
MRWRSSGYATISGIWRGGGGPVKPDRRQNPRDVCFDLKNKGITPVPPSLEPTLVDLRGLKCPLPALRTRKALSRLAPGALLVVECTDPLAEIDIPNLVRETGDALEATAREDDVLVFRIRKRGGG